MIIRSADAICMSAKFPAGPGNIRMQFRLQVLIYPALPIFGAEYDVQQDLGE